MTHPPLAMANAAATAAKKQRAAALIAVSDEENPTSVIDVINAACTPTGRSLLRITLRQLLLAQPGWTSERAGRVLDQTMATLWVENLDLRRLTIVWLVDTRAGGTRFMAFCDALQARAAGPWTAFPTAPKTKSLRDTRTR